MIRPLLALVGLLALLLPGRVVALTGLFELGELTPVPRQLYFSSRATDVSADGRVVVGTAIRGFEYSSSDEAFRWEAGEMVGLAERVTNHERSLGRAVSADGRTVVGALSTYGDADLPDGGFVWVGAQLVGVVPDQPGGSTFSTAYGVSADGRVIAGTSPDAVATQAIRYRDGLPTLLGNLSSSSYAYDVDPTGEILVGRRSGTPVRWDGGVATRLPDPPEGSFGATPEKVSANGRVVVGRSRQSSGDVAIRWKLRSSKLLGRLADDVEARALDTSGDGRVVVGHSWGRETGYRAFIWTAGGGMRPLQEQLEAVYGIDTSGWKLEKANGISDDGTVIVGEGVNPDGRLRGWIARLEDAAVPVCSDGIDNDEDGATDYPDDLGCTTEIDESETSAGVTCDDGIDNDRDGEIDFADDACNDRRTPGEGGTCDDSIDNDDDGLVDWDGGPDQTEPDPTCGGNPHAPESRGPYYASAARAVASTVRPDPPSDRDPTFGVSPLPTMGAQLVGHQKLHVHGICQQDADYQIALKIDLDAGVFTGWDGFVATWGEIVREGKKGRRLVFREARVPQQSRADDIEEYVRQTCLVEDDSVEFALTDFALVGKLNRKGTKIKLKGKYNFAVEASAAPGMRDGVFRFSLGKSRLGEPAVP